MDQKKLRTIYLASKTTLLVVTVITAILGCKYIFLDGYEATSAICWMFSGMCSMLLAVLTE